MKKFYIEIKYCKHSYARIKETMIIKASNSKNAIKMAISQAISYDEYCEISEIIVRIKP